MGDRRQFQGVAGEHGRAPPAQWGEELEHRKVEADRGGSQDARQLRGGKRLPCPQHAGHGAPVLDGHSLRPARGTRGVDQVGQTLRQRHNRQRIRPSLRRLDDLQVTVQCPEPCEMAILRHRQPGARVLEQQGKALVRVGGIERHVRCAGPEHREKRDHQRRGAVQEHRDRPFRTSPQVPEAEGQTPGPRLQIGVRDLLTVPLQRGGVRSPRGLRLEELVKGNPGQIQNRLRAAPCPRLGLLGGGEQRQLGHGTAGIGYRRREEHVEALQEPPRSDGVEQVGGVLERGHETLPHLAQAQREVERRGTLPDRKGFERQSAQVQPSPGLAHRERGEGGRRARRRALEHDHGLKDRRAGGVALRLDGVREQGERVAGVRQRGPDLPPRLRHHLGERRPAREVGPQRHGVDEVTHHRRQRGPAAPRRGRADHQVVLTRVPVEQGLERRRQHLERGRALCPGEGAHRRRLHLQAEG